MVDSIKGAGSIQSGSTVQSNKSNNQNNRAESGNSSQISDEVSISDAALSISEIENTARNARDQLSAQSDATLARRETLEGFLASS